MSGLPADLPVKILQAFIFLCNSIGIFALAFPILVYVNGLLYGIPLGSSISHYYFAKNENEIDPFKFPVRTLFVGGLFAIGMFLLFYKGLTTTENVIINLAGVFALGVAVFPMGRLPIRTVKFSNDREIRITPHAICAVSMFACIFIVAIWTNRATLELVDNIGHRRIYQAAYNVIATLMALFVVIGLILNAVIGNEKSAVFFVETAGIMSFAAFWLVKGSELAEIVLKQDQPWILSYLFAG